MKYFLIGETFYSAGESAEQTTITTAESENEIKLQWMKDNNSTDLRFDSYTGNVFELSNITEISKSDYDILLKYFPKYIF